MPRIVNIILILLIPLVGFSQNSATSAGTSSNLLLRFGTSARVSGMSEAFTGLADDENTLLYNPGGLPNLKHSSLSLNHSEWLEDIRIDNLIYGQRLTYNTTIGLGITHMWMPSIQGKDQYGQTTESFDVSSSIIHLGLGYKIQRAAYLGITIKYFQDKLANFSASGFAFDVGYFMHTAVRGLSLGFSVQNIGGKIKYDQAKQFIPLTYRAGFAYKLFSNQVTFSADVVKSTDTDFSINSGLEFNYEKFFFLRIGNQYSNYQTFNPAYGAGFKIKERFEANYTFSNFEDLGSTHKIGFAFKFNSSSRSYVKPKVSIPEESDLYTPQGNVKVSLINNELLISWQTVKRAKYNVYARSVNQQDWVKINNKSLRTNFMKFKKPNYAGKYIFRVTYLSNNKEIPYPKEATFDVK